MSLEFLESALRILATQRAIVGADICGDFSPARFASLSDRLTTRDGVLLIWGAAIAILVFTRGSVDALVVMYSINVFLTFTLSQLGMVRHWWQERATERRWLRKLLINGVGLILTGFILVSVIVMKFDEGGWITVLVTGALVGVVLLALPLRAADVVEKVLGCLQAHPEKVHVLLHFLNLKSFLRFRRFSGLPEGFHVVKDLAAGG